MDKDILINKLLFSIDQFNVPIETALQQAWTGGYDYYRKNEINHNRKKVEQFNEYGEKLNEFRSIEDAARANQCRRDAIDKSITGKTKLTKKRHYFRYAENGDDQHQ